MNAWWIAVILLVLWLGGYLGNVNIGGNRGVIHILLVIALVVIVIRLLQGRRLIP